jgi:alpha-1,2-glucosyltransferase
MPPSRFHLQMQHSKLQTGSKTNPTLNSSLQSIPAADRTLLLFWLLIGVSLLLGFVAITHLKEPIGDEGVHSYQINSFINGSYEHFKYVTMLPVYHAANAILLKIFGATSLIYLRFANLLLGIIAIPVFLSLVKVHYPCQAYSRTLQFVFIPFLFPLFFLIYTDLLSLAFTLAMIERTIRKRYYVAAIFAFAAVFTRQPNLIWVVYCSLLILADVEKPILRKSFISSYLQKVWPFCIVIMAFGIFVIWNGGIAAGDANQHQISFNVSNFYFFLLVSFALFLPYNISRLNDVKDLLITNKWVILLLVVMFFVYMATYEHPHKYNAKELSFYRHNLFIYYSCDIYWLRILSYFAMSWMALSYYTAARSGKARNHLLLLLPFTLLSTVPLPLIEQRYYLVSLCLFIALRPPIPEKVTVVTLTYYIGVTGFILYHISRMNFFL